MTAAGPWVPEFEGQRPPFQQGNQVAVGNRGPVQHGAYSPRKVEPLATELVEQALEQPDTAFLRAASYRPALWAWARAEARVQLLSEYLGGAAEAAGNGVGDLADERVQAAYLQLHRNETLAMSGRTRLGLDPLSRARLGKDVASAQVDMAQLMARQEQAEREGASS